MASRIVGLIQELKGRRVYRAAAGYAVLAAGGIGLADAALPADLWTRIQLPAVALALLGLPVTMVLVWAFGARGEATEAAEATEPAEAIPAPQTEARKKSIVVLPFDNISPDPGDAYFSEGLTEEIITALSHLHALRVISRSSAMALKGTPKDVRTIARELQVQYVLEGSVRKAGNDLRITAQLIDAGEDAHLWAEQYDGALDDVFGIQERVSRSIVEALGLTLSSRESQRLEERPSGGFRAYDCFLRARHQVYQFTRESLEAGIQTLRHGLELFPDDPLLLAALGEAYFVRYDWGIVREDWVLERAEELAIRALSLNPNSAQGMKLLGHVERYRGSVARACEHFLDAYRLDPTDSGIMLHLAMSLSEVGWGDLAASVYARLLRSDPLTPFNYLMAGVGEVFRGKPDSGLKLIREFRSRAPVVTVPMSGFLAVALFLLGRQAEAVEEVDRALAGEPDPSHEWLLRFIRHAARGERAEALNTLDPEMRAMAWGDADLPLILPALFAHLDLREEALDWMARALERGLFNVPFFAGHGSFGGLRSDPRFQELLAAMMEARQRSPIPGMVRGGSGT